MEIAILVVGIILYLVISSVLVYRRRYEEDWRGGVNYTKETNVCLFLFWPLAASVIIIVSPFYGFYKMVAFIGDKLEKRSRRNNV